MKIQRELYPALQQHLSAREISLIVGPRQVGKTTMMLALKQELDQQGARTLMLNLDIEADRKHFRSQEDLLNRIRLEFGDEPGYVFIDEIQRKENAGLFLKGLFDRNLPYKLIVSGSGSLELKEKIHESLVGRKRMFELFPVSFGEFANYRTEYRYDPRLSDFFRLEPEHTRSLLNEYLNFGGYPRVVTEPLQEEKLRIIDEIFRSYVEKDIVYLLRVDRPEAFVRGIRLLAAYVGRVVNYSQLAAEVGVSVATLKKYLWYAEKTYLIRFFTPFYTNYRKEVTKSPVVYFYDLGLRNYALGLSGALEHPGELGFLFQNLVANLLQEKLRWKPATLHFWRTTDKAEVDFVIRRGQKVIPIEVKYAALKSFSIPPSLRSFIHKYQPEKAYIVTVNEGTSFKLAETEVEFLPFYELVSTELF